MILKEKNNFGSKVKVLTKMSILYKKNFNFYLREGGVTKNTSLFLRAP